MKILVIIIILIALGGGLYLVLNQGALPTSLPNPQNPAAENGNLPKEVEVSLDAQNNSDQVGTATLQKINGKLLVKINLKGEGEGASQPAHIHAGSCPEVGEVKYPLNPVVNGSSQTVLDTNGDDLVKMRPLAVNVHKSATEIKSYVACGNIEF